MLSVLTGGSFLKGADWCWVMVCASFVFPRLYSSPSLSLCPLHYYYYYYHYDDYYKYYDIIFYFISIIDLSP